MRRRRLFLCSAPASRQTPAFGDLAASVGVIIAGAVILLKGWTFIDPLVSILIAALIGWNALKIVTETVNILLEGTPRGVSSQGIASAIRGTDGVQSMHDLHVWSISAENVACSCHIVVGDQSLPDSERMMRAVEERLWADFGIGVGCKYSCSSRAWLA